MFTYDTIIDTYTKTAKQALAYVQPENVRDELLKLVDTQTNMTRSFVNMFESTQQYWMSTLGSAMTPKTAK